MTTLGTSPPGHLAERDRPRPCCRPRSWSILLWIVAVALGYWHATRESPPARIVLMLVGPSSAPRTSFEKELCEAIESQTGEAGLSRELRVQTMHQDVPAERETCKRLGFPNTTTVMCAVVELDETDRPLHVIKRYDRIDDTDDVAREAVTLAREWAGL